MVSFQAAKINVEGIRYLSLRPMDDKKPLASNGNVDPRLFTGENKLKAVRGETSLWTMQYDKGMTPPELRDSYTKFSSLFSSAQTYYKKRNIEVKEILDGQPT